MARDAAGRDQDGVDAHVLERVIALAGEPGFGGGRDARALAVGDRPGRILDRVARLHLDEDQKPSAARDDVDLADWAAPAPRQDTVALGDQEGRGAAFGRDAEPERHLPLRLGTLSDQAALQATLQATLGPLRAHARAPGSD